MDTMLFYILAATVLFSAAAAITRREPLMSAIWLIACLLAVAGVFALLAAPFIAALQVLIAAGAVMVLVLFVIMLVDVGRERLRARVISFGRVLGAIAAAYLALILALAILKPPFLSAPQSGESYEAPVTLAGMMLGRYAVPFELAGLMLLVAVVAAVVLVKRLKTTPHLPSPLRGEERRDTIPSPLRGEERRDTIPSPLRGEGQGEGDER